VDSAAGMSVTARTVTAMPDASAATLRPSPRARGEELLRALVGRPDATLREDQWTAIEALLNHRRALVVQRTGWGKSAVYFVATRMLRDTGAGPTLIVSPLLALMRNQVDAGERAGIRTRTVNSSNIEDWEAIEAAISADEVDVLLVSPERLNNPDFRDRVLPDLARRVGLLVVDEAHCVSDWGHDFRPDYRRIGDLLSRLPAGVPVLGTTATANERVVTDVVEQLAAGSTDEVLTLRGSLDRESLRLGVLRLRDDDERLAWLAEHLHSLPGSGIIYALTVAAAEDVARFLSDRGIPVSSYSGRTDTADRLVAEEALLRNEVKALVATSALGMGFDKPDLGFVIHLGSPQSPIAYYQQVGRAGRGVERADVLLLPGRADEDIWRWFASMSFPAEGDVRRTLAELEAAGAPLSTGALEARVDLRRARLEMMLKVLDVEGAVRRVRGGWEATGRPWAYDAERYARVAQAREREQQAMRDYIATEGCRMEFLRRQLDDPWAEACGRCDRCAGPFVEAAVSDSVRATAHEVLARPGVAIEPRGMWPTGMAVTGVDVRGRIAASESMAEGRAIARLSDLGRGQQVRRVVGSGAPDAELPDDLVGPIVDVLRAWGWERRPAAVVAMASRSRPRLVSSVARRIADIGRLPFLGQLSYAGDGPRGGRGGNSAFRLAGLWGAIAVPDDLRAGLSDLGDQPLLLVDDLADSRWTLTVAARELRAAGAAAVLPFVLGLEG
jgi:ATP-dependent DNA helicase RecQ